MAAKLQSQIVGGDFCDLYRKGLIQTFAAPNCPDSAPTGTVNMTAEDWVKAGMAGNQVAMQWYVLAHPDRQLPVPPSVIPVPGGGQLSFNSNLVVLGIVGIIAFVLLAR